jgi:hypothetical protein
MAALQSVPGGSDILSRGIGWYSINDMELSNSSIKNNEITNFPECGIRFDCNLDHVSITNNTLIDCGSTLADMADKERTPIYINGVNIDTLDISDNIFLDDIAVTRIPYFIYAEASTSSSDFTITGNSFSLTGDRVAFMRLIEVGDNTVQPLITGTIAKFAPPTGQVDTSSAITDDGASHYIVTAWTGDAAPKDWTFEGSDNDVGWTVLDTQTDITFDDNQPRIFDFVDTTPYRYYKLNITENNGNEFSTRLFELTIVRDGDSWTTTDGLIWAGGIIPIMTANNAPPPFVASASGENPGNEAYKAFDGALTYDDSWQTNDITGWLKIDTGA